MKITIMPYIDPETGQEFTSIGWTKKILNKEYGDYILINKLESYNSEEVLMAIDALEKQVQLVEDLIEEEMNSGSCVTGSCK